MCQKRGTVHLVEERTPTDSEEEVLLITVKNVGKKLIAKVPLRIDSARMLEIDCQLDTAASCNVLTVADYRKLGCEPVDPSGTNLTMYDGISLFREASQGLSKEAILNSYQDVFKGTGCLPGKYDIELDEGVFPIQNRPRRIPHMMKTAVESKLAEMEAEGWIVKVDGPTEWISNLTAVWKADKAKPLKSSRGDSRQHFMESRVWQLSQTMFWCLVGGETDEEARQRHDEALVQLLMRARKCNIKFNKEKMRLHMSELQYIGHRISSKGVSPDPAKVRAIQQMAAPKSVTDVRRFLGMCKYLAKFIPNLLATSEPLRRLTEKSIEFQWGEEEQSAFEKLICKNQILAFYDVNKPVLIQCDASAEGLGATLLQEGRPVASVSRSLTKAEKNDVALELECLAIVFACSKFDQYIYGKKVRVETDHRPLEVITKKSILAAPRRLQRMLLALQRHDLEVVYRPGEQQVIADVLSRLPTKSPAGEIESPTLQGILAIHTYSEDNSELERAAVTNPEQIALSQVIKQGWLAHWKEAPEAVRKYWNFRELLVVRDGIIFKGDQVVVPGALRQIYLQKLHSSHMARDSTLRRARDAVYWPGMAEDIGRVTKQCPICEEDSPAQARSKLLVHDIPKQPWSKVGMDLFKCKGKEFLIVVDYLTDFFEVSELPNTLAYTIVEATKREFARHGIPVVVHTDGGPQFVSQEFSSFVKSWEFQHTISSVYNSQSNGKAESAVKIAKRLFKRSRDPYLALLEWRNTPTIGLDSSPSQRLLARRTRGAVPVSDGKLAVNMPPGNWEKKLHRQAQIQRHHSGYGSTFTPLRKGEPVLVQDLRAHKTQWMRGRCEGQLSKSSYTVEVDGQLLHRNRQFLKPSLNSPQLDLGGQDQGLDQLEDQSKEIPVNQEEMPRQVCQVPSLEVPETSGHNSMAQRVKKKLTCPPRDQPQPTEPVITTRSGRIIKKPERLIEHC
ncbi:hypothetical protein EMCRGX_G001194 [Ephydatia muelleri]